MSASRHQLEQAQALPWYANAVFYKLPVKSFFDSNADGVGDLQGLIQKLDYIADLGVTCLWLLPFFPSPLHDDGYDVSDYRNIHPQLGTMDDFRALVIAAHERELKIAAEMVINHTSDEHPWFQAACQAEPGSPQREFYVWSDKPREFASAAASRACNDLNHWTWHAAVGAFYWHRFGRHQPDLNYDSPLVREEMLKVLRFWADLGIDGLCLNGASCLAERMGAGTEHLRETHEILRFFRQEIDRDYPHVMLQAGLNARPKRAADYFGQGGECHLVPNLALAPRAFLALSQESARPLIQLAQQTPVPPDGCQWATLLRNHDELTLSLVSDEERDFLQRAFAGNGSQNGGILRRLASLAKSDRRQMELLLSLLLAWPGAPVIYYGDEIGMGDNPFLRNRGSIRTPMQWSSDQNGGFSTADFAQLFLPPATDPALGYLATNVRAQQRNPSSLLHWLRKLIAIRKKHSTFAKGSLVVLEVDNPQCLVFVREGLSTTGDDERLLVVANLSSRAQHLSLPLHEYQGLIPVELLSRTPFPRINDSPYALTLPPYAWFWFRLQKSSVPSLKQLVEAEVEPVAQIPTISWSGASDEIFAAETQRELEVNVLPGFLRSQRWFGGKSKEIRSIRIADLASLPAQHLKAWHVLLEVEFNAGQRDQYYVPIVFVTEAEAASWFETKRSAIVALLDGKEPGLLLDAAASESFCTALLDSFANPQSTRSEQGQIAVHAADSFSEVRGSTAQALKPRIGPATSSNSLVFFGRRLLLKIFRRLERGINPDYEIGQFLSSNRRFTHSPLVGGKLEYIPQESSAPFTLGILQALIPNQGDGWSHALEELARYYARASARMYSPDPTRPDERSLLELASAAPPPAALETIAGYLNSASLLGARTAEMHLALASDTQASDFKAEPLTEVDLNELKKEVRYQAEQVERALKPNLAQLPKAIQKDAGGLLERLHPTVDSLLESWQSIPLATKTRVHGDYHLGQVLAVDDDYVILDFEGEPTRTIDDRRRKFSPIRDVAGMLRSYHYAAYAGLFGFTHDRPADLPRLAEWADLWQQWVSAAFLKSYLRTAAGASFLPAGQSELALLLNGYTLAKSLYELVYELNNRPDWVRIPLSGVSHLLPESSNKPQHAAHTS